MAQPNATQDHGSHARKYGAFQNEIYIKGMLHGIKPALTKDYNKLEEQAKSTMSPESYSYVAGGAGERATMDANRLVFRQWKLVPRMLRPTTNRDMRTTLFGTTYDTPLLIAPVGVQSIFHPDAEPGVASIAADLGIPYILSTASSHTIEEVAAASGAGHRWFQLYWPQDDEITISLLHRAQEHGYKVLVVTLDTWTLAWRPWDLDLAYIPFFKGIGCAVGFSDPVFRRKLKEKTGKEVEEDVIIASEAWIGAAFSGAAHTWEQLKVIKENWRGPVVLKGIQHPDDAAKAVEEYGIEGIVVSNHGGRQCDGAVGSLEMLPEIVDRVGGKATVLFDSGVRTGVDVIKALSLGAQAVLVGRPWVYGLGIGGKEGAKEILQGLLADLDQSLGLAGIGGVKECKRDMLRRCVYPGDRNSSS